MTYLEGTADNNSLAYRIQGHGPHYQPLSFSIFNVSWHKVRKTRTEGRLGNQDRNYGQTERALVLEMDTPGFCCLSAVCTYSTSLSLSSLFGKIILICRVALRGKHFIENGHVQ